MKPNYTEILLVLDASGSMESLRYESIGSINNFIKDQREIPGEAKLTIVIFSDFNRVKTIIDAKDLNDIKDLTPQDYTCGGMTALNDAGCISIDNLGQRLSNMKEEERPSLVVVAILTDGHENNSHKFSQNDLAKRIKEQTDSYNWKFYFLAANIDAQATAASYNIDAKNAVAFAANAMGVNSVYASTSESIRGLRTSNNT